MGKKRANNALTRSLCTYIVIKRRLSALVLGFLNSAKFLVQNKNAVNAHRCVFCTLFFGVHIHIGVGVIVYSYEKGIAETKESRMSKDKGSTLVFMYGSAGTATCKNYSLCVNVTRLTNVAYE